MRGVPQGWNRNVHYHSVVLDAVPAVCSRALDVGCGAGRLAAALAERCGEVVGVDRDSATLARARSNYARPNLSFVEGDVMTYPFNDESFDFVASVATVHHLPLDDGFRRLRLLLRPGGVLAVIGLYRLSTLADFAWAHAALAISAWHRMTTRMEPVAAPIQDPKETLEEIQSASEHIFPGAEFKRLLLFRYALVWQKP
jgi:SAM-dependent methyltransferase